VKVINTYITNK